MKKYKAFSYAQILMIIVFSALMTAMTIPVVKPLTTTNADGTEQFYNIQTGNYIGDVASTNYVDSYILHEVFWWDPISNKVLTDGKCINEECQTLAQSLGDKDFDGYIDEVTLSMIFDPDDADNPKTMDTLFLKDRQAIVLLQVPKMDKGEAGGDDADE